MRLLVSKLQSIVLLSEGEQRALLGLPVHEFEVATNQTIVREGDSPLRCCVVLDGIACSQKFTADGKRQIVAFHIPGDMPDLLSLHLWTLDVSVATITPCKLGFIRHEAILALFAENPRIGGALWRNTLIDGSISREWMTSIGRRNASAAIAHLMCEMFVKFPAVGLADGNAIKFPITQTEIGDATGLLSLHVNRSLMALRNADLLSLKRGRLTVIDWEGLQRAGGFSPDYLHLDPKEVGNRQ